MTTKKLMNKIVVTLLCFVAVSVITLLYPVIVNRGMGGDESSAGQEDTGQIAVSVTPSPEVVQKNDIAAQKIRVLIKNGEDYYHESVVLTSAGEWMMNQQPHEGQETVELTMANGEFQDEVISVTASEGIAIPSAERAQGVPAYPGEIKVYRGELGLLVVNEVDLETYLQYVVPSEMPASYEMEALKAQAVCARTYAYRNILDEGLAEYHADVDDSIMFQVYNNLTVQERSNQAIQETQGEILMCDGEPITAYFFSTSCGHTSTDEVWNSTEGQAYLKSIYMSEGEEGSLEAEEVFAAFISDNTQPNYEQGEKWYRWHVSLPYTYLNERLAERYPSLGTFVDMQIQKRGEGGAVEELLITGSESTLLINNEYDIRDFLSPGENTIYTNDGESTITSGLLPSAYFIFNAVLDEGIEFIGGGYGHGVGLSQNGANNLAKNSKTYSEILDFFYQNIQIQQLGD